VGDAIAFDYRGGSKEDLMLRKAMVLGFGMLALVPGGSAQAAVKAHIVGVVLPSDARPGERASGSIIMYPNAVSGISGLHVERTKVDIDETQPRKAVLQGIVVDAGGVKRTANLNFYVDIPPAAKTVHVALSSNDEPIAAVDMPIEASTSAPLLCASGDWISGTEADGEPSKFRTPSTYCYAGMAVIAGDFNGDAWQTKIEVGGAKARIVAESVRYCYWMLPQAAAPGINQVTLYEGPHVVTFKVRVPRLDLLQTLEDEGSRAAQGLPSPSDAAASDNPPPSPPIGIGIGGFGFGDDEGEDVEVGRGHERHE
jgi:hypothetical protein